MKPVLLGCKDAFSTNSSLEALCNILQDREFWKRAERLALILGPLFRLSSWIKGCPCHCPRDAEFKNCIKKELRAGEIADKVHEVLSDISDIKQSFDDSSEGLPWRTLSTEILARMSTKCAWLNELPYSIWKASQFSVLGVVPARKCDIYTVSTWCLHVF